MASESEVAVAAAPFERVKIQWNSNETGTGVFDHPIGFMYELHKDPSIAKQVKYFRWNSTDVEDLTDEQQRLFGEMDGCDEVLESFPFASQAQREATRQDFNAAKVHAFLVIILSMLPNLEELELVDADDVEKRQWDLLKGLPGQTVGNRYFQPTPQTLGIKHADTECGEFGWVYARLAFPNVRKFKGSTVIVMQLEDDWLGDADLSRITELELSDSSVDAEAMKDFLKPFKSLKSLRIHQGSALVGDGVGDNEYTPLFLVDAIQQAVGIHLEELSLTGFYSYGGSSEFVHCTVRNMREFKTLKWLEIDVQSFLDEELINDEAEDKEDALEEGFHTEDASSEADVPRLVDILPPNLETLRLSIGRELPEAQDLFDGFAEGRAEKLPALKSIEYVHAWMPKSDEAIELMEPIVEEVEGADCKLVWRGAEAWYPTFGQFCPKHYYPQEEW